MKLTGRKERKLALLADTSYKKLTAWLHYFLTHLIPDTEFDITQVEEGAITLEVKEFTLDEVESVKQSQEEPLVQENISLELWKSKSSNHIR